MVESACFTGVFGGFEGLLSGEKNQSFFRKGLYIQAGKWYNNGVVSEKGFD